MKELLDWYRSQTDENALITAAFLHYKFVIIHPFDDGNGRVSRLLMNYHLMLNGYPPLIIKSADKSNYLYALNQADTGNINAFFEYLGNQLIWSLELSIKAAKGESVEEKDDLYKEIEVWKKQIKSEVPTSPKRNDKLSVELYEKSIAHIFDLIEEKASVFKELFSLFLFAKRYKHSFNKEFQLLNQEILQDYKLKKTDNLVKIIFSLAFAKPINKPEIENNKTSISISINFNIFDYTISIDDKISYSNYPYNQYLNDQEIEKLVNQVMDTLFKKIKTVTA